MGNMFGKRPLAVAEPSPRPSKRARTDNFSAKKYEVFISHRGPDVKHSLAYHISDLLQQRGIRAFFDIKEMEAGQTVPQQIQEAIESSKVQIVIFSERFAESKWCLDELAMMIKKHRDGTSIVIPIFYDVQPYEVRSLKGNFGQNFMNKHPKRQTAQKIEEWNKALQEASEISGFCFLELGGAVVNKVVTKVYNYLQIGILHVPDNVVGIEQLLTKKVEQILEAKEQGCGLTCVEITGIGGIGKTTFASALYNTIHMHFKRCCFIEDVKDKMEKDGPLQIYKALLKDLFYIDTRSTNIAQAKAQLKEYIKNEDVLIVLDDIDLKKSRVSDILVQDGAFLAPTSVIIVTSRDTHIFKNDREFCKSTEVIRVEIPKLRLKESKEVFCKYAFGATDFKYDNIYENLVQKMVEKCDGIPLALKLFGRHVSGEDISYWECFLERVHDSLPGDLKEVLQITFKGLDSKLAQQIFLDVAIFFHGEKVELLENIWVDDPDQNKGCFKFEFEKLKKKCLVEIKCGELRVHDVLRDMAKAIVDEESELEPGHRSRLWRPHDVKHVLSDEMRTEKVKGMRGLWIKEDFVNPCSWNADVFVGMSFLKVLIVEGECIHGDLSKLPRGLLFLRWRNYPYTSVPTHLKSLRVVDFSFGQQEYLWEFQDAPVELRQLILQGCSRIQKLPEWTEKFRWLGKVDMSDCHSLRTIPESFGLLQGLEELDLHGCKELKTLPESSGSLSSLRELSLHGCHSLEDIPETFGQLEKLRLLRLDYCDHLKSLPDSFGHLKSLVVLSLSGCKRLERLSPSFFMLPALKNLDIRKCGLLEPIGGRIASLATLTVLYLSSGKAKNDNSLASGSNYLLLNSSASATVEDLPHNIGDLCNLKHLHLHGFSQLEFPQSFGKLSNLTYLSLKSCFNLQQLPTSFRELHRLETLSITNCPNLQRVSNLPTRLKKFWMSHCESVEVIDVSDLHSLRVLNVRGCSSLKNIMGLIRLDGIEDLTVQDIGGSHITLQLELPQSFGKLTNLRRLTLKSCFNLQQFPNYFCKFHSLESLIIENCPDLQRVSNLPTHLKSFTMVDCESVEVIDVSDLHSLDRLSVRGCSNLKNVMGLIRQDGRGIYTDRPIPGLEKAFILKH